MFCIKPYESKLVQMQWKGLNPIQPTAPLWQLCESGYILNVADAQEYLHILNRS